MLSGRESECARLDELLHRVRRGRSGALVIRGEAGIGKTALLDYAVENAGGMTVVRALGVESEVELDFSALLDVCRPLLDFITEIPEPQAEVLRSALGLGPAAALDRFATGAATLGLLSAASDANPVLVVVDDAQWIDSSSADGLLFATRRLDADRVLVLYAARDGEEQPFDAPGIESISLDGLSREAAATLLGGHAEVTPKVADRLYASTGGNPLALIELPSLLSVEQLAGSAPLDDPLPAGSSIERAFARRAHALPEESRRALLVVAVSTSSAADTIVGALALSGLDVTSLEPSEDAGLLRLVDGRLEFRHPLVRSAVYHAAAPSERRAAHRVLAETCREAEPEECAWHLAAAALGPDEEVASALEQVAGAARRRSGYAAAAAALERAARLTPDRQVALRRLAAAADAAWRAGREGAAAKLVDETLAGTSDSLLRAEVLRLHGAIEYFAGRGERAAEALLEAVTLLESSDPQGAVVAAADAVSALIRARKSAEALETAQQARALAPEDGSKADFAATVALALALSFKGRYGDAEPHLRRADELFRASTTGPHPLQAGRVSTALGWLGRHGEAHTYLAKTVELARAAGAVGSLPHLLAESSWQALHAGHWSEASADASEALELAEELGQPVTAAQALGVLTLLNALRGDEAGLRSIGDETLRRAHASGFGLFELLVTLSRALFDLGTGRVDEAVSKLEELIRHADEPGLSILRYLEGVAPQLELAEAFIRAGRAAEAEAILASFEESQFASASFLAALAERCRGLLAEADRFEAHFVNAVALHEKTECPFALARTQLCYGERLRRARRRADARPHLREAYVTFERLGAEAWSRRAVEELVATGTSVELVAPPVLAELTPHEFRVAGIIATGATNKEIAARLFVTQKTVEYHLRSIYRKLHIRSRSELTRLYLSEHAVGVPA